MLTAEEIKRNYKKFDDWKIIELAQDAGTLRKEIIPILNQEIKDRNLGDDLLIWVGLESNKFTGLERERLIDTIRKEKCSLCLEHGRLEGYEFTTIKSYFIDSQTKNETLIICTECAQTKRTDSIVTTLLWGWWSRYGLFYTPVEVILTLIRWIRHQQEDKETIDLFIDNTTGRIRKSLEKGTLAALITAFNNPKDEDE
ncbi:hypothetical protein [Flavobacterium sp.]|uniref:hypothetical protein n=1 Tax=Flavobacterium sp. TaxID=239 RepID=UPI0039E5F476